MASTRAQIENNSNDGPTGSPTEKGTPGRKKKSKRSPSGQSPERPKGNKKQKNDNQSSEAATNKKKLTKTKSPNKKKKSAELETTPRKRASTKRNTPPSVHEKQIKFGDTEEVTRLALEATTKFSQIIQDNIHTEDEERDYRTFRNNSQSCPLMIHNGMWPWLTDTAIKDGKILCHRIPANHNHLIPQLTNEIKNNILKNPMQVDVKERFHAENMSHDMHCLLTYNNKVCGYYVYKL